MRYEWDERKRLANIAKHGLDFREIGALFEDAHVIVPSAYGGNEARLLAIGQLAGHYVTAVYTIRNETIRLISLRRARHAERQIYEELYRRGA